MKLKNNAILALVAMLPLAGCHDRGETAAAQPPPTVTVMRPVPRHVTEQEEVPGSVAPSATVTLVARVTGVLTSIGFVDGSRVKKGQLLFQIEPDVYRAQLAYDQATLDNANQELTRQKELTGDNATSQSNLQKAQATRDQATAKRDMSRINLGYTEIRAPFAGRIGARTVDVGNIVGTSDSSKLATLDRIQPAYVEFTLNERDANRIGLFKPGKRTVHVSLPGDKTGDDIPLDFVDTHVDSASGALKLRATVSNEDAHLIPGMSVTVQIPAGAPQDVLLVPETSIARDQAGTSVMVVNANSTLEKRLIETAGLYGPLRAVTSGIVPSDQVVTGGALSVAPGRKVQTASAQGQP